MSGHLYPAHAFFSSSRAGLDSTISILTSCNGSRLYPPNLPDAASIADLPLSLAHTTASMKISRFSASLFCINILNIYLLTQYQWINGPLPDKSPFGAGLQQKNGNPIPISYLFLALQGEIPMELIVAEKPRVAEKIAMAIGEDVQKKVHNGISYYEGTSGGNEFVVAPAVGHIYTLIEKEKSRNYPVFDIEWVPSYVASKEAAYTKPYVELLQKLGRKADVFVSACDYDIEGSTIAFNVFRFTTTIREGRRMKFSALTKEDLAEAYANRTDFDYNNANAGEARHILDWYYGINL